jgi:hypothetical protein
MKPTGSASFPLDPDSLRVFHVRLALRVAEAVAQMDPMIEGETGGMWCFFCGGHGAYDDPSIHRDQCVWVLAVALQKQLADRPAGGV